MAGSYGILNVDPLGFKLDKEVSPFDKAMSTASGLYDLFGKHYENKLRGSEANLKNLEAQQKASTLPGLIESINAKSAADTRFYPQQEEAKLGYTRAQIDEVMAKTGLNRAEATAAFARANSSNAEAGLHNANARQAGMGKYGGLLNAYQNSKPGSEEWKYYGALLNKEMGGYSPGNGGMTGGSSARGIGGGGMSEGGIEPNPLGGGPRATFHQGFDPATGETIESPTMSSATRNQVRVEATAELKNMEPIINKGFSPYLGKLGSTKLMYDSALAASSPDSKNGQAAAQRLENYNLASRMKREAANIISRQTSGQAPGVEAAREQEQASFGNLPGQFAGSFIPQKVLQKGMESYIPAQEKMAQQALIQERQGYKQGGEQPSWAGNQQPNQRFAFGQEPRQQPQVAQGFNGNPNLPAQQQEGQQNPQIQQTKTVGNDEYVQINGQWYHK